MPALQAPAGSRLGRGITTIPAWPTERKRLSAHDLGPQSPRGNPVDSSSPLPQPLYKQWVMARGLRAPLLAVRAGPRQMHQGRRGLSAELRPGRQRGRPPVAAPPMSYPSQEVLARWAVLPTAPWRTKRGGQDCPPRKELIRMRIAGMCNRSLLRPTTGLLALAGSASRRRREGAEPWSKRFLYSRPPEQYLYVDEGGRMWYCAPVARGAIRRPLRRGTPRTPPQPAPGSGARIVLTSIHSI